MPTLRIRRFIAAAVLIGGALAGACSEPTASDGIDAPPSDTPAPGSGAVRVAPDTVMMEPGDSMYFVAVDSLANGAKSVANVAWTATAGTVDSSGLYRAPAEPGAYRVVATGSNGADSALVIVKPGIAPTIAMAVSSSYWLEIEPGNLTIAAGATAQFSAAFKTSDGASYGIRPVWQATGGSISASGAYTAPATSGSYLVIVTREGDTMADSALVTVTGGTPPTTGADTTSSSAPIGGESARRSGFWIEVLPSTLSLAPNGTQQFTAVGRTLWQSYSVRVDWRATGGSVSSSGLYRAPASGGTYRVIAKRSGDSQADTTVVTVSGGTTTPPPPPATPTLSAVVLTPASVALAAGAKQQFNAAGRMSDGSTSSVAVTYSATGGAITTAGMYTAGTTAGTFRVIAVQQGGTKADTSAVTLSVATPPPPPPPTGGALGTPDPRLLPSVDLTGTVTTKNPDYAAFQALDPRGKPSGWTYQDPVTGVTVVKLSAAGTPVSGNAHNWYSDGGAVISHAWASGSDWYVTAMVYSDNSGQSSHLVDLKITGTPTLTNWRQLTGQLSPDGDLTFSFSSVPGTARIAYVANGGTLRRINTATMQVENTGNFPRAGVGDGAWLAVDKNDEWIVGMGSRTGQSAWAFNAQSGAFNTQSWSGMDEIRTDRAGGYAILGSGGYTLRLWDLTANTLAPTFTSAIPFAHNASLQGRFLGTNWDANFPAHIWRMARSGGTLTPTPNLYQNGFFGGHEIHWSGNWIQNVSNLDLQWAVCAGLDAYPGLWAKNAVGVVRADGQDARVLGHHYNTYGPDYWSLPFVNISAGGHVVTVNTRLAYSDNNTNNRTDLLAFIMPRSGGQ